MTTTPQEFLSTGTGNPPAEEPREDRELPFAVGYPDPNNSGDLSGMDMGY